MIALRISLKKSPARFLKTIYSMLMISSQKNQFSEIKTILRTVLTRNPKSLQREILVAMIIARALKILILTAVMRILIRFTMAVLVPGVCSLFGRGRMRIQTGIRALLAGVLVAETMVQVLMM